MTGDELYKAGKIDEAIEAQIAAVKAHPADHAKRLFLFELAAFTCDWDRAKRQIEAIRYPEPDLEVASVGYRRLVDAEMQRRAVFVEGKAPKFLSDPPEHLKLRVEAVKKLAVSDIDGTLELLDQAADATPALAGTVNDKPFSDFRDCDDLFGPVLEVMAHGEYYWVPLEQVEALHSKAPQFPRDLIWMPAKLETKDQAGDVFVSLLYPLTFQHKDDQVKLGRTTEWKFEEGPSIGQGLRVMAYEDQFIPLAEVRELVFGTE